MDDYISREAAFELIDNAPIIAGNENETLISAPELSDKVYCIPAADVRPVVRCKDCANRFMTPNGWRCHYAEWAIEDDDFCSCGVNKGVADNG